MQMVKDILLALAATLLAAGPVVALLWFRWRFVVFGPLGVVSLGLFPFGMMAAGGSAWQPGGNPVATMLACWAIGAIGVVTALRFVGGTGKERVIGAFAGMAVTAWVVTFYPVAEGFWSVVGTPP